MNQYQKKAYFEAMQKKREEKEQIIKAANAGGFDHIIEARRIAASNKIKEEDLPF